jgi:integrase
MHLRHLLRHLGNRADATCDLVGFRDLDGYLKARLAERHPNTAERERITLLQFYKWAVQQKYLAASPAAGLAPIKGGDDRPAFRTIGEIDKIIERGGLAEDEILDLWECLYLNPQEIAGLLATVRANARVDYSFLLHAIPAYTGMRRGEVLRLRWLDVDLDEGFVSARSRKQSRRKKETVRRIDLHAELKKELLAWREQRPRGQYVICAAETLEPINPDRANRCFWQPMRHTEWCLDSSKDWFKAGFHTYRHSFASNLAAAGVDQRVIDEFMGHQTEAMRRRYRHLFPKARRSAIESFSLAAGHGT